jgi:hypothetical protein
MDWFALLKMILRVACALGVRISGANFVPPNANKVSVYSMIDFINTNPLGLNDIERSCFHHKLVWIHPFLMEMVEQCD